MTRGGGVGQASRLSHAAEEAMGRYRSWMSRRDLLGCLGAGFIAVGPASLGAAAPQGAKAARLPGAVAPASVPAIRWAAGWLLWRDFKGRKIQLAEALRDLKEFGADGI